MSPGAAAVQIAEPTRQHRLRLWPGVLLVGLQWVARFGIPIVVPGFIGFRNGMMGGLLGALGVLVWWMFFQAVPLGSRGAPPWHSWSLRW